VNIDVERSRYRETGCRGWGICCREYGLEWRYWGEWEELGEWKKFTVLLAAAYVSDVLEVDLVISLKEVRE
jgi:predicted RNase H-like nuclease